MFGLGPATRIYLAAGATDMRKGFEGLYGLVRDRLLCEPQSGHLFLFCNAQRNRLKVLLWDGSGLWVCANNLAENSMRPVAIGRRNWIHIGSPQAGPKIAAILSVVESCRRLKLPVRNYLAEVLPGLADRPIQRLTELTPAAWAIQHP